MNTTNTKPRLLKVYSKASAHRLAKIRFLPQIKLQGLWLKDTGFECGQEILITARPGQLIITTIGEMPEPLINPEFFERGYVKRPKGVNGYGMK